MGSLIFLCDPHLPGVPIHIFFLFKSKLFFLRSLLLYGTFLAYQILAYMTSSDTTHFCVIIDFKKENYVGGVRIMFKLINLLARGVIHQIFRKQ